MLRVEVENVVEEFQNLERGVAHRDRAGDV